MKRAMFLRRRKRQSGSAMLEGALCFNVFLLMLFGTLEMGRMTFVHNHLSYAARDGARYASVRGNSSGRVATSTDVQTYLRGRTLGMDSSVLTVTTTWTPDNKPGSTVNVQASYNYDVLALSRYFGSTFNLSSSAKMLVSQ